MGLAAEGTTTSTWTQKVTDLLKQDRTIKKYACMLYLMNYLHYVWTAKRPSLTYQSSPRAAAILAKCSLLGQHLHTIMLAKLTSHPEIHYERQMVSLADGGAVSLDWAVPPGVAPAAVNVPDIPTVVRPSSLYLHECASRTFVLFCGAYTNDVREVVAKLRRDHVPTAPLVSVGFSLGSNIMVKYIGEEGAACPLSAAVSVGNPYDFMCNSRNMNFSFVHDAIYNGPLATNLNNLFFHQSNAHQMFADHPDINLVALQATTRVWDFDEQLTRRAYASVSEYYRDASSSQYLKHVKIPLLLLSAKDDPICIHTATPFDDVVANEYLMLAVTDTGGHLGFFTGNSVVDVPDMWSANVVAQFCNAIDGLHASDKPSLARCLFRSVDQHNADTQVGATTMNTSGDAASVLDHKGVMMDEEGQVSLRRMAAALAALAVVHFAIKHRHAVHKTWWY
ncbi:hypothetical protein DYB28_012573 [Aphanomyces astaci]|uniref:AB hydrolase-1 domain-containing protein n=1 Tax=Aphanomyces astaci TaxID=112090 RepID=A0A9X8H8T4_APHAT|nr:hypothetical protein DYB28_012573 [Aphanomyces astaci]